MLGHVRSADNEQRFASYRLIVAYVYHAALITILNWFMFRSIPLVAVPC